MSLVACHAPDLCTGPLEAGERQQGCCWADWLLLESAGNLQLCQGQLIKGDRWSVGKGQQDVPVSGTMSHLQPLLHLHNFSKLEHHCLPAVTSPLCPSQFLWRRGRWDAR
jgi:hypothetical protein